MEYDERSNFDIHDMVSVLDFTLDTPRKRHIVGGILISISLLFGGLALTTMTLKEDKQCKDK